MIFGSYLNSQDLNVYIRRHVYSEANRTANGLAKKGLSISYSNVWWSNFSKDVTYISISGSKSVCKILVQ